MIRNQSNQSQDLTIDGIRYKIFNVIGEGTEGIVYKGQNIQTGENVAIKYYKRINLNEYKAVKEICSRNYSNIIGIKAVKEENNNKPIVIMECADGQFYNYMVSQEYKQLSYEQKNQFFIQMVQGVDQLHQMKLFHRDLKPENFVYINNQQKNKNIKLIDFGLVKESTSTDVAKTSCVGSPFYMSPEVLGNLQQLQDTFYDKSVDIWSLGVIWYEMLTDVTFFQCTSQNDLFNWILNWPQSKIDSQIQNNLLIKNKEKDLMKKMIRKIPLERIQLREVIQAYNQDKQYSVQNQQKQFVQIEQNNYQNQFQQVQKIPQQIQQAERQKLQEELKKEMENEILQITDKLKLEKQEELQKIKREIENQKELEYKQNLQNLQKQLMEQYENQIKLKEIELQKQQEMVRQQQVDKNQLIQVKLQFQNEMNQFKINMQDKLNLDMKNYELNRKLEKEKEIQEKIKDKEQQLKNQIEGEIRSKFMIEYSNKVTELENKNIREVQQQFEQSKQSLLIQLQSFQNTITMFDQSLDQHLQLINKMENFGEKQQKLITYITKERAQNNDTLLYVQQSHKQIQQICELEQLKGQDEIIAIKIQQYIEGQNKIQQTITQTLLQLQQQIQVNQKFKEQLNLQEKQNFCQEIQNLQNQFNQFTVNIQNISFKINFYKSIQQEIQDYQKFEQLTVTYQNIKNDIQALLLQESQIICANKADNKINYTYFNQKLKEIQKDFQNLKINIQQQDESMQLIDNEFINKNQNLIDDLLEKLNYCQCQFQQLLQNEKYQNNLKGILKQIDEIFGQINIQKQLLSQEKLFQNYYQFNKIYGKIQQQLVEFEKKYNLLHQQIYEDERIELLQQKRINQFQIVESQLNEFLDKMNEFKTKAKSLNLEQNFIQTKLKRIDQLIQQNQQEFQTLKQFNQYDSYENINMQLINLTQFQKNLNQIQIDEQEQQTQLLQLMSMIVYQNKDEQEKQYKQQNQILINELQLKQLQLQKEFSEIEIESNFINQFEIIKNQKATLDDKLKSEMIILKKYQNLNKDDQILFKEYSEKFKLNKGLNSALELIKKLTDYNKKGTEILDQEFKLIMDKEKKIQFKPIDEKLIKKYESFQSQMKELSRKFKEMVKIQQPNPSQQNDQIPDLIKQYDVLLSQVPEKNEIQKLKESLKEYIGQFQFLYSLINQIKLYRITRYYERLVKGVKQNNANNQAKIQKLEYEKAKNLKLQYENILNSVYNLKMIEELEKDQKQMDQNIQELEKQIKSKNLVKIRCRIKAKNIMDEIFKDEKQLFQEKEFTQMQQLQILNSNRK